MQVSDAFRANLRSARIRRGASQGALAEALGIDRASYNKIESTDPEKQRGVSLDEAVTAAAFLDVPLVDLLLPARGENVELVPGENVDRESAFLWAIGAAPLEEEHEDDFGPSYEALSSAAQRAPGVMYLQALVTALGDAWAAGDAAGMRDVLRNITEQAKHERDTLDAPKPRKRTRGSRNA
jgi:transcriptional regulator with XRE-family HTH domain